MSAEALLKSTHRYFAVETNNQAWNLIDQEQISEAEAERCLAMAWASLHHWLEVGQEMHWARARGTVSRAALRAGDLETALAYAQAYEDALDSEGAEPWDWPFALGAKARALAALEMEDEAQAARKAALEAAASLEDPEDREIAERDLGIGPWFGIA
ncbi:MAG: hypothetical protein KF884_04100 [Fimbriimonadaceae bacterium]|nr:hypothetical protein [Fimbriimonadaceae bacterium]QYK59272.1 MAG: hypothetical protein KF884_04100 [Fimbriimonadaceae bacterium]